VILLLAKPLANVQLPRLLAFYQGFCPWQNATFLVVKEDETEVLMRWWIKNEVRTNTW
jgi:hypothetical protein